ncbi:MAG: CopG family transcriptional regulator [Thermoleophilaceae bacterium]|jgi:predicted transcriptional regulator|nr:CopG family transcriptional regulator [Thermoleophilaceae bacterium]
MVRTIIQLREDQAKGLKRLAAKRDMAVAAVVREAVDGVLESQQTEQSDRVRRAMALAGAGRSGLGDLAENHDDYLADGADGRGE